MKLRTTVKSARRYGSYYLVTLQCGHEETMTAYELAERQLYISKPVTCEEFHDPKQPRKER